MEWKAVIFVEGKDDKRFFLCYLKHLGYDAFAGDGQTASASPEAAQKVYIRETNGAEKMYSDPAVLAQLDKTDLGLFIADANKKRAKREEDFKKFQKRIASTAKTHLFLIPNNKSAGALEGLLLAMARQKDALACMEIYKDCLKEKKFKGSPSGKGEVYAYCEANGAEPHHAKRNYADRDLWDLDCAALKPLRDFLFEHLGKPQRLL